MRRIFAGLLSLWLLGFSWAGHVSAAEPYTYQVTFYTGNHGAFTDAGHVNVDNGKSGSYYQIRVQRSSIVVSGLRFGDRVNFDAAMDGAVSLEENSKYYVKGIRLSGRDNDTVGMSSFEVKGDQEYVVAYGIRGDMTSYIVNYQDTRGNTLAPSRTYYGNVGDRPVIAFLYMEGYEPQAYNLTKTLSANEAENVFTFTYARISTGGSSGGTGTGGGGAAGGEVGSNPAASTPAGDTGVSAAEGAAASAGTGTVTEAAGAEGTADAEMPGGAEDGVAVPDGETPQAEGPEELQELDDEEIPLAGSQAGDDSAGRVRNMARAVAVAGVAAVALFAVLILWLKRRREEEKTEKNH